jgi:hypothetical protein
MITRKYPRLKEEEKDRPPKHIPLWENLVLDGSVINGLPLYSALAGVGAYDKREEFRPALVPEIPPNHPLELYIKARYGYLNESWASSILSKGGLKYDLTLDKFIPIKSIKLGDNFLDFVLHSESTAYGITPPLAPLLNYTIIGLTQEGQTRAFDEYSDNSIIYDAQYLLIVSEEISVEDFCWFWNLRSQRYYLPNNTLPLWLPRTLVESKKDEITRLFQKKGFVLSKSIPSKELQTLAQELGKGIEIATENLDRFYSSQFFLGIKDEYEVFFDEGRVRIPTPQDDVVKYCRHPCYYYVDIEIPGYKLPHLNAGSWGLWIFTDYRVSRTGMSFIRWESELHNYIKFVVPTPWEMLETFAGIPGYSIELSDKGSIAEKLIQLIGDVKKLWLLSGKSVYDLFEQLAEIDQAKEFKSRLRDGLSRLQIEAAEVDNLTEHILQTIASDHHQRKSQTYSQMRETLGFGQKVAKDFITWLIKRSLIFRGVSLQCPVCKTKQWLYIDNMQTMMKCTGCQESVNIPLDVNNVQWKYRINTLYAKAHEQGLIPHLLTLNYGIQQRSSGSVKIQGLFPGIKLKAREGIELPFPEIEIDIAWIEDGELIIGECKTHFRDLSSKEVERYLDLAKLMKCKQLVFSALDDFDGLDSEVKSLIDSASVPVLLLNGEELFNQYPGKKVLIENISEDHTSPDKNFEKQIEQIFDWMKNVS